jgi:hypothetical protein
MWEGSIRENESLIVLFVCVEVPLHAMRPTSSDAKLMGGGWVVVYLVSYPVP